MPQSAQGPSLRDDPSTRDLTLAMQIRIQGYQFEVSEPYEPGQAINLGEAQALNQLRSENIMDNLRKVVRERQDLLPPGHLLSQLDLAELQAIISRYDSVYQFAEKHRPRPKLGAIETEARRVAQERAEAQVRQLGRDASAAEIEARVVALLADPSIQDEARRRVAAQRRVVGSLADLL